MKITRDSEWQIINKQNWGGRVMSRIIEIDGGDFIEAVIYWRDEAERITNQYGVSYNKATGNYNPCLHISYWHAGKTGGMASSGLGNFYPFEDVSVSRRAIKPLIGISKSIDANNIYDMATNKTAPSVIMGG